jgi:hypothetical protein
VYADLEVVWSAQGGPAKRVGELNGIPVYAKTAHRPAIVALPGLAGQNPGPGTLKVTYRDPETRKVLAEASLDVAKEPS